MDAAAITAYITATYPGSIIAEHGGNLFYMKGPDSKMPFATLIGNDDYDQFSNLSREGVFRLNFGLSKTNFQAIPELTAPEPDFTALDVLLPHPVYGDQFWASVLNPGEATWERVKPLLAESYERAKL